MASISGWLAACSVLLAGALPLTHRVLRHKRAPLASSWLSAHVALGIAVSALAFVHVIAAIPSLGESAVVAGGMGALAPGVAAFFCLVAHTGVGLQLRRPNLRDRAQKRRLHLCTASVIVIAAAAHVWMLRR